VHRQGVNHEAYREEDSLDPDEDDDDDDSLREDTDFSSSLTVRDSELTSEEVLPLLLDDEDLQ